MEDEGLLLSNQHLAPAAVIGWSQLGVDVVRIHARWWEIAPQGDAVRKPSGFNANDPDDAGYNWAALDNAVNTVRGDRDARDAHDHRPRAAVGLEQRPAQAQPALDARARRPTPTSRAPSPRATSDQVDRYLIWNEPNQQGWLQPQWECDSRRRNCKPVSPHVYRSLVRAAVARRSTPPTPASRS